MTEARIAADLADLARGAHPGRTRADEITVFKSVGFALEDLAAAEAVFDAADATAADDRVGGREPRVSARTGIPRGKRRCVSGCCRM